MTLPDRECLEKLRARELAACRAFVDAHYRGVHRFFTWLTRNGDTAADLTQDTFLAFWESTARLDPCAALDLKAWLYGIARNRWRKWCRDRGPGDGGRGTGDRGAEWSGDVERAELESPAPGPEELALAAMERERVEAALEELAADYREALVLRVFEELTYEQIGRVLGIPEGLARWRVHRARQRLWQALEWGGEVVGR